MDSEGMFTFHADIAIPFLWGSGRFKKSRWGTVNLMVGANGTGKTLLAEQLARQLQKAGKRTVFIRAERIGNSGSGIPEAVLKRLTERPDIKENIETVLSEMFRKTMYLAEEEGELIPRVRTLATGAEYDVRDGECHGLKEIITLLTALYDDSHDVLILDEPEMHLHPQFQTFFLSEIRKQAEGGKVFFIITHSPYFIDIRTLEDLQSIILCHRDALPTHIEKITGEHEWLLKKFLPRFNTHHKQFFFSDVPVFVEGYTDQQIFTLLLEKISPPVNTGGISVIDVGGKDELGVFFILCAELGTPSRIIADLDALFRGKLRDVLCADGRPDRYLRDRGIAESIRDALSRLERSLVNFGEILNEAEPQAGRFGKFITRIQGFYNGAAKAEDLDTFKTIMLQGALEMPEQLMPLLPEFMAEELSGLPGLFSDILTAAEESRIFILPRGSIELYYTRHQVDFLQISGKDRLFHTEREYLLRNDSVCISAEYEELIDILRRTYS